MYIQPKNLEPALWSKGAESHARPQPVRTLANNPGRCSDDHPTLLQHRWLNTVPANTLARFDADKAHTSYVSSVYDSNIAGTDP